MKLLSLLLIDSNGGFMKYLKIIISVTFFQLTSWLLFITVDFIEEITNKSIFSVICFCMVYLFLIISSTFYFNLEKKMNIAKLKLFFLTNIIWILESLIIGLNIWNLVNFNKWIILQDRSGIMNLNGLEYFIFIWALIMVPILVILIVKILKKIYSKIVMSGRKV